MTRCSVKGCGRAAVIEVAEFLGPDRPDISLLSVEAADSRRVLCPEHLSEAVEDADEADSLLFACDLEE